MHTHSWIVSIEYSSGAEVFLITASDMNVLKFVLSKENLIRL